MINDSHMSEKSSAQSTQTVQLGFWKDVKAAAVKRGDAILVLAPMANVTDAAFRRIIAKYSRMNQKGGGPDVLWTEFVSADGLCSPKGRVMLVRDLAFDAATEHPIVAQLFSSNPEKMREAAALVQSLGFDGIDINMGCPDKTIEKQGAGAAMMRNPNLAREIIRAAKEGAPNIPISVKTRVGYNKVEIDTWIPEILAENPAVLTIHARTRKEMSDVPARWEHVKEVVALRDKIQAGQTDKTLIFGNGDVTDCIDANTRVLAAGADGAMLGRAIFGNPWLFDATKVPSVRERLEVLVEHTRLFEQLLGDIKSFAIMKKHFKAYVAGWDGAKELRAELMETENAEQLEAIITKYLATTK
jgi:nifR3 family TIM-barrel protein